MRDGSRLILKIVRSGSQLLKSSRTSDIGYVYNIVRDDFGFTIIFFILYKIYVWNFIFFFKSVIYKNYRSFPRTCSQAARNK